MKISTSSGEHETHREHVYHRLQLALMAGDYEPGQKITIAAVAAALDVSATPVREALRRLTAEGALVMNPNSSVTVPRFSSAEALAIRGVRAQLEPYAVRLAAPRIDQDRLDSLAEIEVAMAAARDRRDGRRLQTLNKDFHFTVYEACGVPVLTDLIGKLWLLSASTLNLLFRPEHFGRYRLAIQNRNNHALVAALRNHDGERAAKALLAEIEEGSRMLAALMVDTGWDESARKPVRKRRA